MSDETPVTEEQLFDSDGGEVAEDHATDSDGENEESPEEEQEQGLDLPEEENEEPTSKAEESKLAQIRAFQKKVNAGDYASAKDLPKAQKWMKDFLRFPDSEAKVDTEALKKELLEEAKGERERLAQREQFDRLRETLNGRADAGQKQLIRSKFKELRAKGLSILDALQLSAELASVDLDGQKERRRAMRIPVPGSLKGKGLDPDSMSYSEFAKKAPAERRLKYLESLQ